MASYFVCTLDKNLEKTQKKQTKQILLFIETHALPPLIFHIFVPIKVPYPSAILYDIWFVVNDGELHQMLQQTLPEAQ